MKQISQQDLKLDISSMQYRYIVWNLKAKNSHKFKDPG